MTTSLYPVEVQSLLFRQLLAYETLLKPEYKLYIERHTSGNLWVTVINIETYFCKPAWKFDPYTIPTAKKLDAALAEFWNEVPQKFKLEQ